MTCETSISPNAELCVTACKHLIGGLGRSPITLIQVDGGRVGEVRALCMVRAGLALAIRCKEVVRKTLTADTIALATSIGVHTFVTHKAFVVHARPRSAIDLLCVHEDPSGCEREAMESAHFGRLHEIVSDDQNCVNRQAASV